MINNNSMSRFIFAVYTRKINVKLESRVESLSILYKISSTIGIILRSLKTYYIFWFFSY